MANIQQYLNNILNAIYGEDVRGSIHDAIDIINKVGEKVLTIGTAVTAPNSPTSGYYDGSLYLNSSTWILWKCTGSAWAEQGSIKGAVGQTGPQGQKGDKGDKGDTGQTGPQGQKGDIGNIFGIGTIVNSEYTSVTIDGVTYRENDLYINTQSWHVWQCTGSAWVDLGSIKGRDGTGSGDMAKAVYDPDEDGVIDLVALPFDGFATDTDILNIISRRGGS